MIFFRGDFLVFSLEPKLEADLEGVMIGGDVELKDNNLWPRPFYGGEHPGTQRYPVKPELEKQQG